MIRQEFGGDRAAFVRTLQAQGFTVTRFKEIERDKIIIQAMRQSESRQQFRHLADADPELLRQEQERPTRRPSR